MAEHARRQIGSVATSLLCLLFRARARCQRTRPTFIPGSAGIRERRRFGRRHASVWTPVPVDTWRTSKAGRITRAPLFTASPVNTRGQGRSRPLAGRSSPAAPLRVWRRRAAATASKVKVGDGGGRGLRQWRAAATTLSARVRRRSHVCAIRVVCHGFFARFRRAAHAIGGSEFDAATIELRRRMPSSQGTAAGRNGNWMA